MGIIQTALAFLTTYKKYAGILLIVAGFALCAWLGSSYQKAKCEAQIADFKAQMATQIKQQEKDYAERLSKATSDLVLANRRADDARGERDNLLMRLRTADARITERTETDTNRSYRAEYARCRGFLSEGAELLSESSDLVGRVAREKDTLSELVK